MYPPKMYTLRDNKLLMHAFRSSSLLPNSSPNTNRSTVRLKIAKDEKKSR